METRKITVVSTKTQSKKTFMSNATTLEELKRDLRNEGIDYADMTFYEGISKTELKDDSSVLPHDVPYKGQATNELVFMLTNTNKKIKSGAEMSRKDIYDEIKKNNLQSLCVDRYGKNFTMCKTTDLEALVKEAMSSNTIVDKTVKETSEDKPLGCCSNNTEVIDVKARAAIKEIIEVLRFESVMDKEESDKILASFGFSASSSVAKESSPYSDREIDDMFNFLN